MKGRVRHIKSQNVETDYISPWDDIQQNRNDLETFLSKHKIPKDSQANLNSYSKTQSLNKRRQSLFQTNQYKPKIRTFNKTCTDHFSKSMQKAFHRKIYSQSASLQKDKYNTLQPKTLDNPIFSKKCKLSKKPNMVKVQYPSATQPVETQSLKPHFFMKKDNLYQNHFKLCRERKIFIQKRHSIAHNQLKSQIFHHKKFVNSLEGCLFQISKIAGDQKSNQALSKTLKNFLSHYKKI